MVSRGLFIYAWKIFSKYKGGLECGQIEMRHVLYPGGRSFISRQGCIMNKNTCLDSHGGLGAVRLFVRELLTRPIPLANFRFSAKL
jgi:hypothetical protein